MYDGMVQCLCMSVHSSTPQGKDKKKTNMVNIIKPVTYIVDWKICQG